MHLSSPEARAMPSPIMMTVPVSACDDLIFVMLDLLFDELGNFLGF